MSDIFFTELALPRPDYELGIGSGSHGWRDRTDARASKEVLQAERPDWVFVYGDTNSTLAGALAAVKLGIPVASSRTARLQPLDAGAQPRAHRPLR